MGELQELEEANIYKAFIDAHPPGFRIVFNSATGEQSPHAIGQAPLSLVERVHAERHLNLQPLRLILVTANVDEAADFWNGELGLPEAGVSDGAVGKQFSWGNDQDSARSIVILHAGIGVGLVSGLSNRRPLYHSRIGPRE